MLSMVGWMLALGLSVSSVILAAAMKMPLAHMGVAGLVSLAVALVAIQDHQKMVAEGAPASLIGSTDARYIGLVWAWAALAIFVTYAFIFTGTWPEWWQFTFGFFFAAAISLVFANMLKSDGEAGKVDDTILKIGRGLIFGQLAGVAVGVVTMFIEGKFPRDITYPDWAAINIFFFGAIAIAAISFNALRTPAKA